MSRVKVTRDEFQERLRKGDPSVEVMGGKDNSIVITSWNLQPGQEKLVARRLQQELLQASK
jgi:L-seryl-tRNA(Ser) seleniumtransferase